MLYVVVVVVVGGDQCVGNAVWVKDFVINAYSTGSLVCSLVSSHCLHICLLRTACVLYCARSFARLLTRSRAHGKEISQFQPIVLNYDSVAHEGEMLCWIARIA